MTNKKDELNGAPSRGMPEPRAGAQMPPRRSLRRLDRMPTIAQNTA